MGKKPKSFTVYFGSELDSFKHLLGNAYLAEAIYERSHGRYLCQLPQDSAPGEARPRVLRDLDIRTLIGCDLALFVLAGADHSSRTATEFMLAKFADIPVVVLGSGAHGDAGHPASWSLRTGFYPRTVAIRLDGLAAYRSAMQRRHRRLDEVMRLAGQHSSADVQRMCEEAAAACVRAFDRVRTLEPVMPRHLRESVYNWLPLAPGLRGKEKALRKEFERHLERKVERDLL